MGRMRRSSRKRRRRTDCSPTAQMSMRGNSMGRRRRSRKWRRRTDCSPTAQMSMMGEQHGDEVL